MVADGGYTTRDNIEKMAGREIDFLGSMGREEMPSGATAPNRLPPSAFVYQAETNRYVCPEGKLLRPQGRHTSKEARARSPISTRLNSVTANLAAANPNAARKIRAMAAAYCGWKKVAVVVAFREKMASKEAQAQYRRRGRVVEFCHAWIKSKLGLRQFHVRGLAKVQSEMLWACLTYNLQQWIRLSKPLLIPAAN